jgi:hypothetical protein
MGHGGIARLDGRVDWGGLIDDLDSSLWRFDSPILHHAEQFCLALERNGTLYVLTETAA